MNRRLLDIARAKSELFNLRLKKRHQEKYNPQQQQQEIPNGAQEQSPVEPGQPNDNQQPPDISQG